ncbi:nuclear transport factor 2 family protein [Acetobacter orientalis]|uniref:AtzH-like domain-containing protein n=1 Tax=Acetobacter orientalis TaxID=146474 RepID=UPI00209EE228|nr:AtzH-like domain-containing protein [Acetobacter orientalis]MCP1217134.1 nuclear transport factor 2 family protein [Acetobacter orientalis]MCP1220013.1 nuclear transport factor 2 family protein [Acetobacter orientalis]
MFPTSSELLQTLSALSDAYEQALGTNDLEKLDSFFYDGPEVVRYGVGENLYGAEQIAAFRRARQGGSPPRTVLRRSITPLSSHVAVISLEFERQGSQSIGRQTQTWINTNTGWKIIVAHVSMMKEYS